MNGFKSSPCLDCAARNLGCHSTCRKYISAKASYEAAKAAEKREKDKETQYMDYTMSIAQRKKIRGGKEVVWQI